jgi:hypothetical protein
MQDFGAQEIDNTLHFMDSTHYGQAEVQVQTDRSSSVGTEAEGGVDISHGAVQLAGRCKHVVTCGRLRRWGQSRGSG